MTKIYLARHGQDQDNANAILNGHRDTPLTKIGLTQADQLSQKIKESGIVLGIKVKMCCYFRVNFVPFK
jgi:probable phosphoglycerate mutase